MRVKFLKNVAEWHVGDIATIPPEQASRLLRTGYAVAAPDEKKVKAA